ncbi:MAG: T9SS type A sorting domain-containing protein [Sphingomonadales bacterium]|nr:T9SS type A sorting domain-containing protein [Sphingomonadales bacterium]
MKNKILLMSILFLLTGVKGMCQNLFAIDTIQKIEIQFSMANWDYILDTAKAGSDRYTMAQWVKINGVRFDSAGVKYKGNSSYNVNNTKNPFHIELDHFIPQDYMGYKDIKLSNGWRDPSFVREALTYKILQNYMHAPLANFAQVYVNGQYIGLYTNTEAVTKNFLQARFLSNDHSFFYADNGGCNLVFRGNDSTLYFSPYTKKSDYGYADLMRLCDSLANNISGIENILDVDRALWMLAITHALVILDSYIGGPQHNFYIYKDHNGKFNPIIWDLNGAFGTFSNLGQGMNLTLTQKQTLPVIVHANDSLWPLIKNLMSVPMFKRMYIAHMRTVANEILANSYYYTTAQYLQSICDTAYQSDANAFFTYTQFLSNLTTNVASGPSSIPGLTNLMGARTSFLYSTSEFQQTQPAISNVQPSDTFPLINSTIYITASVSNTNAVYCGLRGSVMDKFSRIQMFDDGLNGDGAPGDGVYGTTVAVSSPEIHYYIYAENNNAGMFSPQRAEHEWHTLNTDYTTLTTGEVVINEIAAMNSTIQTNGLGNFNDWVELYNTTNDTILLDYLFISDDFSNSDKWQCPSGTKIPPNGYSVIWADNDVFAGELHSGFNLSGSGEQMILSYANGTIIDSVTFPAQRTDITYGRYPNGTGTFVFMSPTFNAVNLVTGHTEQDRYNKGIHIYPNPFSAQTTLYTDEFLNAASLTVYNLDGQQVYQIKNISGNTVTIQRNGLATGLYFVRLTENNKQPATKKIIITD